MEQSPPTENGSNILQKIHDLEAGQALLMSKLALVDAHGRKQQEKGRSHSVSPQRNSRRSGGFEGRKMGSSGSYGHSSSRLQRESRNDESSNGGGFRFSERFFENVLQSMGQAVFVLDVEGRIVYWNRTAEQLYGHPESNIIGQNAIELLFSPNDFRMANDIVERVIMGDNWKGKLPMKSMSGDSFQAFATYTPFYGDHGSLVGVTCVSCDSRHFQDTLNSQYFTRPNMSSCENPDRPRNSFANKHDFEPQQPLQVTIASKITDLASKVTDKVRSRMKRGEISMDREFASGDSHSDHEAILIDHKDDGASSGTSTPRGTVQHGAFGASCAVTEDKSPRKANKFSNEESERKSGIQKIISSKAEALFSKKGISWSWKGHEQDGTDARNHFVLPWLHGDRERDNEGHSPRASESSCRSEGPVNETNRACNTEATGSWSSFNANSTSSVSSGGSTTSSAVHRVDVESDSLDSEIVWEDLVIGDQIGQGSCGTVYRALWYGSDVAVKVFSRQEYSDEVILSFRQEVSLMKRLRHPNILLFMGAITSPERLCIVTEFLPRGSLFRLLQRNTTKLDWRRRTHMAIDIARGMNYLHHCNPPIVHRDLKSSNLLVDKNWTVKVADFGLSRLKHETYLTTKMGRGTPQWMAPEVLRNEPSDEKSDVYSYGVILWELVTEKIPWDNLNAMQIIGAVGFMDQRLELPNDLDLQWTSIIESCWHSEPQRRPTFQQLLERFRDLQRQYVVQTQMQRTANETNNSKVKHMVEEPA